MRDTKKWRNKFDPYDKYRLAAFFEEQARNGWILEDNEGTAFSFRRSEPKKLHYCIIFCPDKTIFDTKLTERQETFCDFCAISGWNLVTSKGYLQVFCNENEDPVPIQTEPELELKNIHAYYKSSQRPMLILYILSLFQIMTRGCSLAMGNQSSEGQVHDIVGIVVYGMLLLVYMIELLGYYAWYKKAKQAIALGLGIPPTSGNPTRRIITYGLVIGAMIVLILGMSITESLKGMLVIFLAVAFMLVSTFTLIKVLRSKLFARYDSAFKTGLYYLIAPIIFMLSFALIIGLVLTV